MLSPVFSTAEQRERKKVGNHTRDQRATLHSKNLELKSYNQPYLRKKIPKRFVFCNTFTLINNIILLSWLPGGTLPSPTFVPSPAVRWWCGWGFQQTWSGAEAAGSPHLCVIASSTTKLKDWLLCPGTLQQQGFEPAPLWLQGEHSSTLPMPPQT